MAKAGYTGEQPSRIAREESYPGAWTGQEQLQEIKANNWPKAIYEIERSLRFNSADSAYLSRTPASAGNQKTWTWAGWVKRSSFGTSQYFFGNYFNAANDGTSVRFTASDQIDIFDLTSGSFAYQLTSTQVFRDPSAWYHFVVSLDTTQATSANRLKIYVNGSEMTTWATSTYPTQNTDYDLNNTQLHAIGGSGSFAGQYFDGYLGDIHFIDGQALTPSSFTKTDATTGQLIPKAYTGTYGTNGFHLPFSDNSTAAALGTDTSGNGNTWTVNNITANVTQPALYSSPNLYTSAADVIANGTPLFSGSTFSNVYVYLVTNSGGDVGSKVFTADGAGTIGGSSWTWLHRIGAAWEFLGSYNNAEWDLWTWGSQTTATTYVMNNSAPLHMLVSSAGSPQQVSGTIATFNSTPNSGAGNDSLVDTPTNYGTDTGAGGEMRGNYCTISPLDRNRLASTETLSQGNLEVTFGSGDFGSRGTFYVTSGKWYWEATLKTAGTGFISCGISQQSSQYYTGYSAGSYAYLKTGDKMENAATIAYGDPYTANDVIGIALDLDAGTLEFYKNGVSQGQAFSGVSGAFTPSVGSSSSNGTAWILNFGQRPFAYTAPSGYKCLADTSLPTPVVAQPSTVMDVKLYTGNGSTQTISGLGFSPDLVWLKRRDNGTYAHSLVDTVRGAGLRLSSNLTSAEDAFDAVTAFTSDGFTLGNTVLNDSATSSVAWTWDAGSSTVTNTQGSITSQVRANASAGFSIVTFTMPSSGTNTVGHGLGVAPSLVILKSRANTSGWVVYHASTGAGGYTLLNSTDAYSADSGAFNNTAPTSSVFTVSTSFNGLSGSYIAYCFAPVAGYSSFGSYTGNGSTDGPFVFTGMRPRWILLKNSTNAYSWYLYDTARGAYNVVETALFPDSAGEDTVDSAYAIDILSNGFKLRNSNIRSNGSSNTYIYAAFAESPQKFSRAR